MRYIIYKPANEKSGETLASESTALYTHVDYPSRRYIGRFPAISDIMKLVKCKTLHEAIMERDAANKYSGSNYQIREYSFGKIGAVISDD